MQCKYREVCHSTEMNLPYLCRMTGKCCTGKIVSLTPFDIFRIAREQDKNPSVLFQEKTLAYRIDLGTFWMVPVIALRKNAECRFLADDRSCNIYSARPFACRLFPLKFDPSLKNFYRSTGAEAVCIECISDGHSVEEEKYLSDSGAGKMQEEYLLTNELISRISLSGFNIQEIKKKKKKQKIFFALQSLMYETYPQNNEESYPFEKMKKEAEKMMSEYGGEDELF